MATITEELGTDIRHIKDYSVRAKGDRDIISGLDNLKQALLRRLMTEPGALIHRTDYGVGIKRFLNAPNTLSNHRTIATRIDEQFKRDPRVEKVLGVLITPDDKLPDKLTIVVRVKVVGYDEVEMKFIPFGEV